MASENSFSSVVLCDLDLPSELLVVLEANQLTTESLVKISQDELNEVLASDKTIWNVDEIFRRLIEWRKSNGYDLFTFTEVYLEQEWLDPNKGIAIEADEDIVGLSQSQLKKSSETQSEAEAHPTSNPTLPTQNNRAVPYSVQESTQTTTSRSVHVKAEIADSSRPKFSKTSEAQSGAEAHPTLSSAESSSLLEPTKAATSRVVQIKATQSFCPSILVDLLNKTITRQEILKRGQRGPLSKESQRELVGIIADHHNSLGISVKEEVLREYGEAIIAQFQHETLDTYFVARGGRRKNHGGKLFNRITNLKQKSIKRKLKEEEHLSGEKSKAVPSVAGDPTAEEAIVWLERNSRPWSTVLDKWVPSFTLRKPHLLNAKNIDEVLTRYHHYSDEHGYQIDSRRQLWLQRSGNEEIQNLSLTARRFVCEVHFEERFLRRQFHRTTLSRDAVPMTYCTVFRLVTDDRSGPERNDDEGEKNPAGGETDSIQVVPTGSENEGTEYETIEEEHLLESEPIDFEEIEEPDELQEQVLEHQDTSKRKYYETISTQTEDPEKPCESPPRKKTKCKESNKPTTDQTTNTDHIAIETEPLESPEKCTNSTTEQATHTDDQEQKTEDEYFLLSLIEPLQRLPPEKRAIAKVKMLTYLVQLGCGMGDARL